MSPLAAGSAAVPAWLAAADPIAAFCQDTILWGPMAGSNVLTEAVRVAHVEVLALIQKAQP